MLDLLRFGFVIFAVSLKGKRNDALFKLIDIELGWSVCGWALWVDWWNILEKHLPVTDYWVYLLERKILVLVCCRILDRTWSGLNIIFLQKLFKVWLMFRYFHFLLLCLFQYFYLFLLLFLSFSFLLLFRLFLGLLWTSVFLSRFLDLDNKLSWWLLLLNHIFLLLEENRHF